MPLEIMGYHVGEMNPDQLHDTTMNKENRRLKQITMSDVDRAQKVFNDLMGSSVTPRKEFIDNNAHRARIDV